nr:MAG TPA: hypothetical protein [Caudoviricetes sp.]
MIDCRPWKFGKPWSTINVCTLKFKNLMEDGMDN